MFYGIFVLSCFVTSCCMVLFRLLLLFWYVNVVRDSPTKHIINSINDGNIGIISIIVSETVILL